MDAMEQGDVRFVVLVVVGGVVVVVCVCLSYVGKIPNKSISPSNTLEIK